MVLTLGDDKNRFGYGRAREIKLGFELGMKRVWHICDNKTGYNNHGMCYAVSDIPLVSVFDYGQHNPTTKCFDDSMCALFSVKESAKCNLSNRAAFSVDQGYMRTCLLQW